MNLIWLISFLWFKQAQAFPDTIRHGYSNCSTCHVSPTGGGILTSYGRSLSRELMSTWGYVNEEQILHGLAGIKTSDETLLYGGDVRYLSRHLESNKDNVGKTTTDEGFVMQAQLRLGLAWEKIKLIASIGKIENPRTDKEVKLLSPEYYALWTPKEEVYLKFGRFEPMHGLRLPDHNLWINSEAGFVPWAERDTAEFIYEGEKQMASLAGFQSTSATSLAMQNTGYLANFYQMIGERSRVGASLLNSEGQGFRKRWQSLHSTLTLSETTYTMLELSRVLNGGNAREMAFLRFGVEVSKGLSPYFQVQARRDPNQSNSNQERYGIGFCWLPRPHFELSGISEYGQSQGEHSQDSFLVLHYYL